VKTANESLISSTQNMPWTSDAIHVGTVAAYAIQLKYVTSSANVKLQVSCDAGNPQTASESWRGEKVLNWTDLSNSETVLVESGDLTFDVDNASYKWVRVVCTGTGVVLSARFNSKGS
jgi:hypothetical protein